MLVQPDAGYEDATIAWSSKALNLTGIASDGQQLVVPAAALPPVGPIDLTALLNLGGASGSLTTLVDLAAAPACTDSNGCFGTSLSADTFPNAIVEASADKFQDTGVLT